MGSRKMTLTLSLTDEARARHKVHGLYTLGKFQLPDVTCGRGTEGRRRMMNVGCTEERMK